MDTLLTMKQNNENLIQVGKENGRNNISQMS